MANDDSHIHWATSYAAIMQASCWKINININGNIKFKRPVGSRSDFHDCLSIADGIDFLKENSMSERRSLNGACVMLTLALAFLNID